MDFDKVAFAMRLKYLMSETKTTQQDLADAVKITRQSVAQYIDGSTLPNVEKLYLISKYFNASTDSLLGIETEEPYYTESLESKIKELRGIIQNVKMALGRVD